ncbi:MAG: hypothetical protein U5L45_05605 [Saprospiraceae bacterium]|nr:hypothetical protein [Saprospiraceae bacterium]
MSAQTTASVNVSISLPSVALLDVEPNGGFNFNLISPTEAGNPSTTTATNNTKWLNFTSAVVKGTTRKIMVQSVGSLPNGINLKLVTANYTGTGAGALGNAVSPLYLSSTQQTVVNAIGGAFTGNGVGNGYNLMYSLEIANYGLLRNQSASVSILYTLMDN